MVSGNSSSDDEETNVVKDIKKKRVLKAFEDSDDESKQSSEGSNHAELINCENLKGESSLDLNRSFVIEDFLNIKESENSSQSE